MIRNNPLRYLLGAFLAGLAGLSFCISVLPVALQIAGAGTQDYLGVILSQYAVYAALIWAVGGWSTARAGFLKAGMIIMGLVGVATGLILVAWGITPEPGYLAAGGLSGLVYGLVGGMILGRILEKPPGSAGSEDR